MKSYLVVMPLVGKASVMVTADDEKSAIKKALNAEWSAEFTGIDCDDLETRERIVSGNILHAPVNEPYAEESQ